MMHVHHTHLDNIVKSRVVVGKWCSCIVVGKFSILQNKIQKKELQQARVCVWEGVMGRAAGNKVRRVRLFACKVRGQIFYLF